MPLASLSSPFMVVLLPAAAMKVVVVLSFTGEQTLEVRVLVPFSSTMRPSFSSLKMHRPSEDVRLIVTFVSVTVLVLLLYLTVPLVILSPVTLLQLELVTGTPPILKP